MTPFPEERDEILSLCLEKLIQAHWSLEECVALFPEWRDDIIALMPLVRTFRQAQAIHPRPSFRVASRQRLERRVELRSGSARTPSRKRPSIFRRRRVRSPQPALWPFALASLAVILLLTLVTGVVTVRAADDAVPGELLYRLDRALESRAVARESDPTVATIKQLRHAQERIEEMETLVAEGNTAYVAVALGEYGTIVGSVVAGSAAAPDANQALTRAVNDALAVQAMRLDQVLMPTGGQEEAVASAECASAGGGRLPAAAATIARLYGASEADIAGWHCKGHNFGEIVVALETNRKTAIPAQELLAQRMESPGWGQVWQVMNKETPASQPDQPGRPEAPGNADPPGQQGERPVNANAPGQGGERPGNANPPGQPEGNQGNANPPGQQEGGPDNANPPGQQEGEPGNANPPGQQGEPAGNPNPPGQEGNPGNSQNPPGQPDKPDK